LGEEASDRAKRVFEARSTNAPEDTDHALTLIRGLFRVEHDATEQKIVRSGRGLKRSLNGPVDCAKFGHFL
jgi:hypothetical protein